MLVWITKGDRMNVAKMQAAAAPIRHERVDAAQKPNVNPAQDQKKQAQVQAAQEARKTNEAKAGGVQKGGEINSTA
jgi:hypothetical protein